MSIALLEAREAARGWGCPRSCIRPIKADCFYTAPACKSWEGPTTHECTHTHTHKHSVQNIYLEQVCSHGMLSSRFTLRTSWQRCTRTAPNPLGLSTCLNQTVPSHQSTKRNRENNRGKKSILSPRSTGPVSSHFPPASTDLGRSWVLCHPEPPSQAQKGGGESCSATLAAWFPLLRKKRHGKKRKKKERFPFPLGKSLFSISLVAWKSLAGVKGERR